MRDEGFQPDLSPQAYQQVKAIAATETLSESLPTEADDIRDLRGLLWSSIDNPESRDLDQVEWAERLPDDSIRLMVGIADVDSLVAAWTPLDAYAVRSTTSVYTGVVTFPMLPDLLSTDRTSLNVGQDRLAIVIEMVVSPKGDVVYGSGTVYRALLHNHAKLDYESVGAWLDTNAASTTPPPEMVSVVPGLEEQILLQDEAAVRLARRRRRAGSLELDTAEAHPVITPAGQVELHIVKNNRARSLIENLMVTANTVMCHFLQDRGLATIQRVVRPPERWARIVALAESYGDHLPPDPHPKPLAAFLSRRQAADPLRFPDLSLAIVKLLGPGEYVLVRPGEPSPGHFGLAVTNYTHSTAPNRRYPDLILQRMAKAVLKGDPVPYTPGDLDLMAQHCTEREAASRKVERLMRKIAGAVLLKDRIGDSFEAIVTGIGRKGTYVRVLSPPVEGRVVVGNAGLDVGDVVRVRLVGTDPMQGWIDFSRLFSYG
jgi:exoribonuclease-2